MGLLFCCPSCGTDLRVNPAAAVLVSCPGCGEAVRVPRRPHPREAATDTPSLPLHLRDGAGRGLRSLSLSVWTFATAAACVMASFLFRATVGYPPPGEYPVWLPPVQVVLAGGWLAFACGGCALRLRGYLKCRTTAERYALGGWVTAATLGVCMSAVGALAVVPLVIGRPTLTLPPTGAGFLLIGLTTGLVGVLFEFAFLVVVNRLLWETAGWQAAAHTGQYAVMVVFGMVAVMAAMCFGVMALVLTTDGKGVNTDAAGVSVQKTIAVLVILAVSSISGWLTWRFARLLQLTCRAVSQPEPTPDPPVPSGG